MKTEVVSVQLITRIDPKTLPNGVYKGSWGGYVVDVSIGGKLINLITEHGVRTPSASCTVTVKDGIVTVEAK